MLEIAICVIEHVCGRDAHTFVTDMLTLQSVKSMTTVLGGTFVATARRISSGVAGIDSLGSVAPHAAARNARSVAGEVFSPGTGFVKGCGVRGEQRDCEKVSATACVRPVALFSETAGSS
jgi:hypothetical protein